MHAELKEECSMLLGMTWGLSTCLTLVEVCFIVQEIFFTISRAPLNHIHICSMAAFMRLLTPS